MKNEFFKKQSIDAKSQTQFDYVIIGAGSSGCVLADRLSASGRYTVCLLEAGPRGHYPWLHIPIGYAKTMFHPRYNWKFYTEPEPGLHNRQIYWPRGKVLGGSSAINGLIYIRGQHQDYDQWAELGNVGWSWADVRPYFIHSERNQRGASDYHGDSGPMGVCDVKQPNRLAEAFVQACTQAGYPRNPDFNGQNQEGAGFYQLTTWNGLRSSSASAYLKPARHRSGLHIVTDAQVEQIKFQDNQARAVVYRRGHTEHTLLAEREIILSAGAVQSPQLLQLSGIGEARCLQQFGIPVVQDLPEVGRNLQDHLQVRLIHRTTHPGTTNSQMRNPWSWLCMGIGYVLSRSGPMAVGINQAGAFIRSSDAVNRPDIQFHFAALSADLPGAPLHSFPGFTSSVCQLRPTSRGSVTLKSRHAQAAPAICPNYLTTEHDRLTIVAGLKTARQITAQPALNTHISAEYSPGSSVQTDDELLAFARETGVTIFHPVGTCRMGSDDRAVVDVRLKVRGVTGLRVVDCSVMPFLVSGNTHAAAVMIGEKGADMILQDAKSS